MPEAGRRLAQRQVLILGREVGMLGTHASKRSFDSWCASPQGPFMPKAS